ncbi:hypothetical protein TPA0906_65840 [Streptomyces olivaceus]|uniref:hypothetical protein n=1 Tax=Streptomyces olivaceus TaxID=47716 RepID=UPI0022ED4DB2|nr:hypothetical protein [Streptomyces olivaceus]GHJ04719.1 hypothetical protein TPA0906_65840 [Streptomyces olivaceus]
MPRSSQTALIIDQSKIRIDEGLIRRGAPGFPRSLDWWKRNTPLWLDATEDEQGRIILEPNGLQANGVTREVTPALRRRHLQYARSWAAGLTFLDLSDAIGFAGGAA